MTLLISVSTLDESPAALPKKSGAYATSSSKPSTLPMAPNETLALIFLSWQPVRFGHCASPPKSNPMSGLIKPCARAGVAVPMAMPIANMPRSRRRPRDVQFICSTVFVFMDSSRRPPRRESTGESCIRFTATAVEGVASGRGHHFDFRGDASHASNGVGDLNRLQMRFERFRLPRQQHNPVVHRGDGNTTGIDAAVRLERRLDAL